MNSPYPTEKNISGMKLFADNDAKGVSWGSYLTIFLMIKGSYVGNHKIVIVLWGRIRNQDYTEKEPQCITFLPCN